jgi:hypothetical protein
MACTGATPPNPPNYKRGSYDEYLRAYPASPTTAVPWFDDGAAGPLHTFATNTAALASGTSAADNAGGTALAGAGGTGVNSSVGTYPGAAAGAVPASTSVAHEAAGTEVTVLAPGNISHTYVVGTLDMSRTASVGPAMTATLREAGPNASHASNGQVAGTPGAMPTLASITPTTAAAAASGTQLITCTGTGFTNQCRIWVDNMERTTTFTSATSIACTINKKPSAGAWLVDVKLGGVAVASTRTFTWT